MHAARSARGLACRLQGRHRAGRACSCVQACHATAAQACRVGCPLRIQAQAGQEGQGPVPVSAAPAADPQRARRLLLARRARISKMVAGTSCLRGALVCLALLAAAGFQAAGAAPSAKLDAWSNSRPRACPDKLRVGERRGAELRGAGAAAAEWRVPVDADAAGRERQPGPECALQRARAARAAAAAVGRVRPPDAVC